MTSQHTTRVPSDDEASDVVVLRGPGLVGLAVAVVVFAQLLPPPVRAVVVVPLVLLVPGWLAANGLFGRARPADPVVVVTFVIALGMGTLILNGLVVNAIGVRLSEFSLLVGPAVISCALLALAWVRGADLSLRVPIASGPRIVARALVLSCVLGMAVAAVTYAAGRLPAAASPPFAEVSFAATYAQNAQPLRVAPRQVVVLPIEVRLHGLVRVRYRIVTSVDGTRVSEAHYDVTEPLWRGTVRVTSPTGHCLHRVQILFLAQAPAVKRGSLDTYLSVSGGPACRR